LVLEALDGLAELAQLDVQLGVHRYLALELEHPLIFGNDPLLFLVV
jgi:hypothetical protein